MLKKFVSTIMAVAVMTTGVFASSINTISRSNIVVRDETSLAFANILIEPRNEVETGSSIIIELTNATIFDQSIIDGTSSDEKAIGYNAGGYQYKYGGSMWNTSDGFGDVMPKVDTAQLPYKIRKINDQQMEVFLINVPDTYVNNSLANVNGVSRTPYYSIPFVAYSDGIGDITMSIDSNGTSISDGMLSNAEIYDKYSKDTTSTESTSVTTTEATTETTTQAQTTVDTSSVNVSIQIGADHMMVNDNKVSLDVPAYIQTQSQSTLVPLRAISEAFGGNDAVEWDANTKTATINYGSIKVKFTSGGDYMNVNGIPIAMPGNVRAEITNGRMFVPFRVIGEALGLDVSWDANTKTAYYKG